MASVTKYFYGSSSNSRLNYETNDPNEAIYSLTFA